MKLMLTAAGPKRDQKQQEEFSFKKLLSEFFLLVSPSSDHFLDSKPRNESEEF